MTTEHMAKFIKKNQQCTIVFGERRTAHNKPVVCVNDITDNGLMYYKFLDGTSMLLTREDLLSADYEPRWEL